MKKYLSLLFFLFLFKITVAQDVTFTFANAQNTNDGTDDFYEVDILAESTAGFKLGSGLIYINYNTAAFGVQVFTNGNFAASYPTGGSPDYVVGSQHPFGLGFYTSFVTNDNNNSRVAFSWQPALSEGSFASNNITSTAIHLFHIKIKYVDVNQDPMICFESSAVFTDQTSTACGPNAGFGLADCINNPGTQITNDSYDCAGASLPALPVELISFTARAEDKHSRLDWSTASELNNEGFEIERLGLNDKWETLDFIIGKGTTTEINDYLFYDKNPKLGINYYRLKQIDLDGKYEYSNIESVAFEETNSEYLIYPNPVLSENVNIRIPNDGTEVSVFDGKGRLVYYSEMKKGVNEISLDHFSAGLYFVKFVNRGEVGIKRLVINN